MLLVLVWAVVHLVLKQLTATLVVRRRYLLTVWCALRLVNV